MLGSSFRQMKENWLELRQVELVRQRNLKKITDMQQDLVQTIHRVEQLTHRQEEIDSETAQTKKKLADSQKYQKDLEERDVKLNGEYISLLEKQSSGT